jgi:hypothetical protein
MDITDMTERRAFLTKLALSGIALTGAGQVKPETSPHPALATGDEGMHDVRAFGAKGDGVTDDTAAFNAATSAAAAVSVQGSRIGVFVPPGTYRIDGTVFVHKGQSLTGAGDASLIDASRARGRTIVLGRDSRDRDDPGGAPATIGELRFWGGSDRAPLIDVPLAGFAIRNLFITAAGIAIAIGGGEGIVSNVIIDQALNGIVLRGARNVLIDNLICYSVNYAITIDSSTNDIALSNMIAAYSKNASILFAEGATGITSIRVSGATFVSNIEYRSFIGHIHARAQAFDAQFSDCVFRNWRGFAVTQEAGSGARLTFANCTFDGARSHASYNASGTASGIRTGVDAHFRFTDCRFLRLPGPVASIGPSLGALTFDGGLIHDCRGDPIRFVARGGGRIRVRGVDGFGRQIEQGGTSSIVLPWCGTTTVWRVGAAKRGSPGGATLATVAACATNDVIACSITQEQRYGAPLMLACGLGAGPQAPQRAPLGEGNGTLCVTAPGREIDWTVETAI